MNRKLIGPVVAVTVLTAACAPRAAAPANAPAPRAGAVAGGASNGPRPYAQVVPARASTDAGAITSHRVDDKWLLEVPDSLLGRDFLLVGRIAATPANFGAYLPAGVSVQERMVRFERQGERLVLRVVGAEAVADDSLPIARSVASN